MKILFGALERTIQGTTISDFKNYLEKFGGVRKWMLISDYCVGNRTKPNDVVSFVLIPYIMELTQWKDFINAIQPSDIKNGRTISDDFCRFTHSGLVFNFTFTMSREDNYFKRYNTKESLTRLIDQYIQMMNAWVKNTPENQKHYRYIQTQLITLKNKMNAKSFNLTLLNRIISVSFLASYIKFILLREVPDIEIFSWLSDRDEITSFCDGIYKIFYEITSHCLCERQLKEYNSKKIKNVIPKDANDIFYDELVRVADIYCGIIADYNFKTNEVTKDKHLKGIEQIFADNKFLSVISIDGSGVKRGEFYSKHLE